MEEFERNGEQGEIKNAFVQRVIAALTHSSPEMKVRDLEQPSHGSLKRKEQSNTSSPICSLREKAQVVLICKSLRNEELRPTSSSEVGLRTVACSSLLQRRRAPKSL